MIEKKRKNDVIRSNLDIPSKLKKLAQFFRKLRLIRLGHRDASPDKKYQIDNFMKHSTFTNPNDTKQKPTDQRRSIEIRKKKRKLSMSRKTRPPKK